MRQAAELGLFLKNIGDVDAESALGLVKITWGDVNAKIASCAVKWRCTEVGEIL